MAEIRHIEIAEADGERLRDFYQRLFGWEGNRREIAGFDYYDVHSESAVTTGIRHEPTGSAEIVVYVEVDDVAASVAEVERLGGRVRIPPMEHGDLKFELVEDPEGNPIGLTEVPG